MNCSHTFRRFVAGRGGEDPGMSKSDESCACDLRAALRFALGGMMYNLDTEGGA